MELPGSTPKLAAERPKPAAERPPVVMASVKFCSLALNPPPTQPTQTHTHAQPTVYCKSTAPMQHKPQYRPPCGLRATGVARRSARVGDSGAALWAPPDGRQPSERTCGSRRGSPHLSGAAAPPRRRRRSAATSAARRRRLLPRTREKGAKRKNPQMVFAY